MPFTLSHPAIALPLIKPLGRFGIATALVIGSLCPDLAYFLPFPISRTQSHSLFGVLWFCIPSGYLCFFLFYLLFAPLAHALFPNSISKRLPTEWATARTLNPVSVPITISIVIGSLTHIAWDYFTHGDGAASTFLPWLATPIIKIGGYTLYVYGALQHASGLLGLAFIAWWLYRLYTKTPPDGVASFLNRRLRWLCVIAILAPPFIIGVAAAAEFFDAALEPVAKLQQIVGAAVFAVGPPFLVAVTLAAIMIALARPKPKSGVPLE